MEIGNLFGKKADTPKDLFLAIQIQEDLVKTALWEVADGQPKIIEYGPVNNWTDDESLLVATDSSLASALNGIEADVSRVIFGLPENWIKGDKISPDQAPILKKLIDKLELKPVGFVTTTEAIIQFLKVNEGIPPTVIVLELNLGRVNLTVTRLGQIVGREEIVRSDDLAKDVAEGLTRLNLDQLPARFLIINGSESEAEQQLVSYSWQDDFPFLHIPKVELPEPHFSIQAVAVAGGVEAARSLGLPISTEDSPPSPTVDTSSSLSASDFGFVTDDEEVMTPHEQEPEKVEEAQIHPVPPITPISAITKKPFPFSVPHLPQFLSNLKLPSLRFPKLGLAAPLIIAAILLLGVPLAAFVVSRVFSSAQVTVFVNNSNLTKTIDLSISDKPHPTLPTLSATSDVITLEKTDSIPTTGEATVGEKAQGEVTIFNKSDSQKTLSKGSIIATSTNLKFILNESVSVASRSAVEQDGGINIVYGKATVPVTASAIGSDSNIAENTTLSVATFPSSTIDAKSNSAFKGGSSKTVQAVSKTDQDKLVEKLTQALKEEASIKQSAASETEKVLAGKDLKITNKDFDKGVGEEATSLSLTLKAEVPLWRYQVSDLNTLLTSALAADIPSGFTLDPVNTTISLQEFDTDKQGVITAKAAVNAKLTPNIPIDEFTKKLSGLSVIKANSLLQTIAGYQKAKILINPPIPYLSTYLPTNPSRIHLTISAQ